MLGAWVFVPNEVQNLNIVDDTGDRVERVVGTWRLRSSFYVALGDLGHSREPAGNDPAIAVIGIRGT
ncbi:MAG: hypothetical protein IPM54_10740 [Polyangiaceae bacterium]|nr:hypothetical protein [Polyangiaceae bacterium]